MATPPLNRARELYFAGLIFVVCQSTAKTAKIGPLENFPLYGIIPAHKVVGVYSHCAIACLHYCYSCILKYMYVMQI